MILAALLAAAYTNLAGNAICGEPLRIAGDRVVLRRAAGGEATLPLAIFPAGERARLRAAAGARELPEALKDLAKEIAAQRRRARKRAANGRLTSAELSEKSANLDAGWVHAVETTPGLSPDDISYWKEHLP